MASTAATVAFCMVDGCARAPQKRETYAQGEGKLIDEVCGAHTGRLAERLQMLSNETLPGEVVYTMEGSST